MFHYRIYLLDSTGKIVSGSDAHHRDDQSACADTQLALNEGEVAEVWRGARCIARVMAIPKAG